MSSLSLNIPTSFFIGVFGGIFINGYPYMRLNMWGCWHLYPIFSFVLLSMFLFLTYFIFMRRDVK
jgi:hypothetical protein